MDQVVATVTLDTDAKIAGVKGDMALMKVELSHEIEKHSTAIETKLTSFSADLGTRLARLPGRGTMWGAAGTVVAALVGTLIAAVAIAVSTFNAGVDTAAISADRSADARVGVETLTGISAAQQEQISKQQEQLDKIIVLLQQQQPEATP